MTEKETEGIALLKHYAADPDGRVVLTRMAESIRVANRFERRRWTPTARHHGGWTVTLRTGKTQAIILSRDKVEILLVPKLLGADEREVLERAAHKEDGPFKQVPGSLRYTLDWPKAIELWGSVEKAHREVLQHKRPRTRSTNPEADALIDYLSRELELDLPYPDQELVGPDGKAQNTPTVDDCLRMLTRRAVPNGQIQLYQALLAAGSKGATTAELVSTMGRRDAKDFNGVLLALGNRINRTPGYGETQKPGIEMILRISEADEGRRYHLKPVMREALEAHAPSWLPGAATSRPPPLPAPPPAPTKPRFGELVKSIEAKGLHFPTETVANYVLALQTKRFAILTGISGTGKTQIAKAVARSFGATIRDRQAVEPDGAAARADEVKMTARPYHFDYRQIVLPTAFVARIEPFLIPEPGTNGGMIATSYPGGRTKLRFWRDPNPNRNVTWLMFAAAYDFRDWYQTRLQPDDRYYISFREGEQPDQHQIEFRLPETSVTERSLDNYTVVPVRPDWVDNRGLLGYLNPITGAYSMTPFLSLLLGAREEERRADKGGRDPHPFFVVLDEMNLARVEHYFSDFLSALESDEPIPLHDNQEIEDGAAESGVPVPRQLRIPKNVFFTGTVNVDETTYMFSPKVLDRAFTIEFDRVDLAGYTDGVATSESGELDLSADTDGALRFTPYEKPDRGDWLEFTGIARGRYARILRELHAILEGENRHFGYRVANEIARFVNLAREQSADGDEATKAAFDLALRQKVLPKFHGTQQELEPLLERLFNFAVHGGERRRRDTDVSLDEWMVVDGRLTPSGRAASSADVPTGTAQSDTDGSVDETEGPGSENETDADAGDSEKGPDPEFPRTAAKLWRMLQRLEQRGFAAFIE